MEVCDNCSDEDVEYEDSDGMESYCSDCFLELDPEYVKFHGIGKISDHIKQQVKSLNHDD